MSEKSTNYTTTTTNSNLGNLDLLSKTDLDSLPDKDMLNQSEQMSEISNDKDESKNQDIIRKMFDRMHQDNNINFKEIENNPMYGHDLQNR